VVKHIWQVATMVAVAAAVLGLAGGLVACGGSADEASPGPTTYTEADSGQTVSAAVGDEIAVTLKENPSTGYEWDLKPGPGLTVVSNDYAGPSASPSPMIGAGGTRTWVFKVDEAGTLTLTGLYVRPWEPSSKSASDFSLTIDAQ
jgi:inhibitor of cysteine peptidase